jgi:hypothetical protein
MVSAYPYKGIREGHLRRAPGYAAEDSAKKCLMADQGVMRDWDSGQLSTRLK